MSEFETIFGPPTDDAFFSVVTAQTLSKHSEQVRRRHVVRHPGGSAVVPIIDGRAICVEQYRPAVQGVVLEIPGGRPESGEDPETTARRELSEEVGLVAGHLELLTRLRAAPCFSDWLAHIYLAEELVLAKRPDMHGEFPTNVRMVELDSVEALVASGVLVDAKTIVGLLLARARLISSSPEMARQLK